MIQQRSKPEEKNRDSKDSLTDLIRTGAQQLIAQALKAKAEISLIDLSRNQGPLLFDTLSCLAHDNLIRPVVHRYYKRNLIYF